MYRISVRFRVVLLSMRTETMFSTSVQVRHWAKRDYAMNLTCQYRFRECVVYMHLWKKNMNIRLIYLFIACVPIVGCGGGGGGGTASPGLPPPATIQPAVGNNLPGPRPVAEPQTYVNFESARVRPLGNEKLMCLLRILGLTAPF